MLLILGLEGSVEFDSKDDFIMGLDPGDRGIAL
jgi:hypothetical protein